ncbi:MAG: DUF4921 family protein [Candidatus Nanopelagicales bacterium]
MQRWPVLPVPAEPVPAEPVSPDTDPDRTPVGYQLQRLPDGTVRQRSPLSGTVVWTVPGRSHRPLTAPRPDPAPLDPADHDRRCAFCAGRHLETPPEKSRIVRGPDVSPGAQPRWQVLRHLRAEQLEDTEPVARRVPNLFEILPLEYWQANHAFAIPPDVRARAQAYAATPAGREHVLAIMGTRARAAGTPAEQVAGLPADELVAASVRLFASMHDVIVARRHFVDGATRDDGLASAGDLTSEEHHAYLALTIDAAQDLTAASPDVAYVSVFGNWLAAAGASFEHLHRQLVAIDEYGPLMSRIVDLLHGTPDLFNLGVLDPTVRDRLVIAGNDHAIALAGVGHRYPTIEIYSTGAAHRPWEHSDAAVRGMSDLLHACHAATGRLVPSNEEWHYRPLGAPVAMPWRINLKWRISTLAGFEGGTKINVNTISPTQVRQRMVAGLLGLRASGRIAPLAIGDECPHRSGALGYLRGRPESAPA